MAPLQPVQNVLKFIFDFKIGSDANAMSHQYWSYTGTAPTSATCITLAGDVLFALETRFGPLMSPNVVLEGVQCTDLSSNASGQGFSPANFPGTRTGSELPAATCLLVNGLIARRYRGGKPRFYYPLGTATDVLTGQTWSATALTAFQAGVNNLQTDMAAINASGCQLQHAVNVSYYSGTTQKTNGTTGRLYDVPIARPIPYQDPILSFPVNPKFGSQRRRNQHGS